MSIQSGVPDTGTNALGGGYYTPPPGQGGVHSVFGDLDPGPQPFLGGNAAAANQYLQGVGGQQQSLQNAALSAQNMIANPDPIANYNNANTFATRGNGAYGQAQQAYGQMQNATGLAQSAAMGGQPSAAQLQQSAGIAQAARAQMAAAASTRGGGMQQAAAGQQAAMQGAQLQAQGIGQNAQLRAQEMAQARGQYSQDTGAMQGAAMGMGQLGLAQQAQAAQQAQYQAGLGQQAQSMRNQMQLGLGQQGLGYGQLGLSGMQSQLGADTAYQQQLEQAKQAGAQQDTQLVTGIMGAAGGVLGALSDIRAKQNVQPVSGGKPAAAQQPWQVQMGQAQIEPQAGGQPSVAMAQTPEPAAPKLTGMTKDQAMAFLKGGSLPAQQPTQPQPWTVQTGAPVMDPQQPQPLVSDERAKSGGGDAQHVADAYLDHLAKSAATYSYKDPSQAPAQREPGAKFGGVMAQDLQSVPEIGQQLVTDTPQGKTLEGGSNLSALMMGLGRLHERLKKAGY